MKKNIERAALSLSPTRLPLLAPTAPATRRDKSGKPRPPALPPEAPSSTLLRPSSACGGVAPLPHIDPRYLVPDLAGGGKADLGLRLFHV